MFDVYYIGDNQNIADNVPFARKVETEGDINARTKMYWLIEPNVEIVDYEVLDYRPPAYDQKYTHIWKWDSRNYGGLKLLPKQDSEGVKEINRVVCKKRFAILHTETPEDYFESHLSATHVWCVDPEYKLAEELDWAPDNFEPDFIHSFHLRGQLEHRYPAQEGGIKLYPRKWRTADIKYHTFLDASAVYPVLFVEDPEDYAQRDVLEDEYVWLIDKQYQIEPSTIDWIPNPFEREYIHSFRMPNQLQEKTWSFKHPTSDRRLGGIRLVPKDWRKATGGHEGGGVIIHQDCPIKDVQYDVFYIDEEDFNADTYQELAERSKTEWFWTVDREYDFNGKLMFVPEDHEVDYIHVFKIPDMLEDRYPADFVQPWDNRCGGIRLVHKHFDMTKHKYQENIIPVKYDIFYTDTPKQYESFARKSSTKMFWLIDNEYQLDNNFKIVVPKHEQKYILNFQVNQLEHKYPEQEGGIYLIPKTATDGTQTKFKGSLGETFKRFPVLRVKDINDLSSVTEDCWVIDEEYNIDEAIKWTPSNFQMNSMHTFHVGDQLRHKYPEDMGGMRWVPLNWDGNYVIHDETVATSKRYPVVKTDDVTVESVTEDQWVIDSDYQIQDIINWAPSVFECKAIHTFHVKGQLEHKYPEAMGGMRWVPADWNGEYVVHSETLDVAKQYPIIRSDYVELTEVKDDCWLIDNEYQIEEKFTWTPTVFNKNSIHTFHVPGQLAHKYPDEMGGLRWVPANWDGSIVIHDDNITTETSYPVIWVDDVEDLSVVKADGWVVDKQYQIEDARINWIPSVFERNSIHTFHVGTQLRDKYPEGMGGLRWIPIEWDGNYVIHESLDNVEKQYPINFVEDPTVAPATDEPQWQVDKAYRIYDSINWVPGDYDKDKVHVFHVHNQLTNKYTETMGGVYWWPGNQTEYKLKVHQDPLRIPVKQYPVLFVEDVADVSNVTEACWLVDKEYEIEETISVIPYQNQEEADMIHTYHVKGQLDHKYPEAMGGVRWVPGNNAKAEVKIHDVTPFGDTLKFEIFDSEEEGRKKTTTGWFWVIDPDVELVPEFKLDFVPKVWDKGKTHVWQKLNPVTNRQFDYAGVSLYPKEPQAKGRPKYIREPACTQKPYEVFYLTTENGIVEQLESFDQQATSKLYWVIDPYTRLAEDFNFDYYPSQWDEKNVHVFLSESERGDHKNVRLYPKGTFVEGHDHTEKSVHNNTFENLKAMNTVASLPPRWPDVTLVDMTRDELVHHITTHREQGHPFLWTIDVDVDAASNVFDRGYLPNTQNLHKIHMWQRVSPHSGLVHSYGGVRLWPTDMDTDTITTDTVLMNKIKGIQYVREPGCYYKTYDVVLLTYHDEDAEQKYQALKEKVPGAKWIKDVDGIFEAHQAAAELAETKMFWVVDADAQVQADFEFHYIPDQYDQETVHVWNSQNPITGDVYGYGGVKLFNRQQVLDATSWGLDFTTGLSKRLKVVNEISCTTAFNTDAFSTWRSAFRETVKLSSKRDKDSKARLERWLTPDNPDADFAEQALLGAQAGAEYGSKYSQKPMRLAKINDYDWLRSQYDNS